MPLETRQKNILLNDYAWPVGCGLLQSWLGDSLPNEPCALSFLMPSKGWFLPEFRERNTRAVATLLLMPSLKTNPFAYSESATILPITLQVYLIPKSEVSKARDLFENLVIPKLTALLTQQTRGVFWLGTNDSWSSLYDARA